MSLLLFFEQFDTVDIHHDYNQTDALSILQRLESAVKYYETEYVTDNSDRQINNYANSCLKYTTKQR